MFNKFTIPQLKNIIKEYNLHTKISNYSRMKKELLINEINKHLIMIGDEIKCKENNSKINLVDTKKKINVSDTKKIISKDTYLKKSKDSKKEEPKLELMNYYHLRDLIKHFCRVGDIEDLDYRKSYYEDSLLYSLDYQYSNYTPEMIKEYHRFYEYLNNNIDEMIISQKTRSKLQEKIKESESVHGKIHEFFHLKTVDPQAHRPYFK